MLSRPLESLSFPLLGPTLGATAQAWLVNAHRAVLGTLEAISEWTQQRGYGSFSFVKVPNILRVSRRK